MKMCPHHNKPIKEFSFDELQLIMRHGSWGGDLSHPIVEVECRMCGEEYCYGCSNQGHSDCKMPLDGTGNRKHFIIHLDKIPQPSRGRKKHKIRQ